MLQHNGDLRQSINKTYGLSPLCTIIELTLDETDFLRSQEEKLRQYQHYVREKKWLEASAIVRNISPEETRTSYIEQYCKFLESLYHEGTDTSAAILIPFIEIGYEQLFIEEQLRFKRHKFNSLLQAFWSRTNFTGAKEKEFFNTEEFVTKEDINDASEFLRDVIDKIPSYRKFWGLKSNQEDLESLLLSLDKWQTGDMKAQMPGSLQTSIQEYQSLLDLLSFQNIPDAFEKFRKHIKRIILNLERGREKETNHELHGAFFYYQQALYLDPLSRPIFDQWRKHKAELARSQSPWLVSITGYVNKDNMEVASQVVGKDLQRLKTNDDISTLMRQTCEDFLPFWYTEPQAREFLFLLEFFRQRLDGNTNILFELSQQPWPISKRLYEYALEKTKAATDITIIHDTVTADSDSKPVFSDTETVASWRSNSFSGDSALVIASSSQDDHKSEHRNAHFSKRTRVAAVTVLMVFIIVNILFNIGRVRPQQQTVPELPTSAELAAVPSDHSQPTSTPTPLITPVLPVESYVNMTETPEPTATSTITPEPTAMPAVTLEPTPMTSLPIQPRIIREFISGQIDSPFLFLRDPDLGISRRGFYSSDGRWYFTSHSVEEIGEFFPWSDATTRANFSTILNPREIPLVGGISVSGRMNRENLAGQSFGIYVRDKQTDATLALLITQISNRQIMIGTQTVPTFLSLEDVPFFSGSLQSCEAISSFEFESVWNFEFQLYLILDGTRGDFFVGGQDLLTNFNYPVVYCGSLIDVSEISEIGLIGVGDNVDIRIERLEVLGK